MVRCAACVKMWSQVRDEDEFATSLVIRIIMTVLPAGERYHCHGLVSFCLLDKDVVFDF